MVFRGISFQSNLGLKIFCSIKIFKGNQFWFRPHKQTKWFPDSPVFRYLLAWNTSRVGFSIKSYKKLSFAILCHLPVVSFSVASRSMMKGLVLFLLQVSLLYFLITVHSTEGQLSWNSIRMGRRSFNNVSIEETVFLSLTWESRSLNWIKTNRSPQQNGPNESLK